MQMDGIKIEGYTGEWHVIDEREFHGEKIYLLEHDTYGDEAAGLIVNEKKEVILDDVWDGFSALNNLEDYKNNETD